MTGWGWGLKGLCRNVMMTLRHDVRGKKVINGPYLKILMIEFVFKVDIMVYANLNSRNNYLSRV